jgi:broad specificity phosphatase PhoE
MIAVEIQRSRMKIYFVTHPQVAIEPAIPVREWPLSDMGRERMASMLKQPWVQCIGFIGSSQERKALDAAEILSRNINVLVRVFVDLGENDRTSTGYLAPDEFQFTADLFFAHPDESIRGWEPARTAQRRIIEAVEDVVAAADGCGGDVAILAHGGVGARCYSAILRRNRSAAEKTNLALAAATTLYSRPVRMRYCRAGVRSNRSIEGWVPQLRSDGFVGLAELWVGIERTSPARLEAFGRNAFIS